MSVTAITSLPATTLQVVQGVSDPIAASLVAAGADVATFMSEHTEKDKWKIGQFALNHLGWPPRTDVEEKELALMHAIAATRTPGGIEAAKFWSDHGMRDVWEPWLRLYASTHSVQQARAATQLLHDTLDQVNEYTQIAKAAAARKRPFVVDPTLEVAVEKPGNNPSFPSGHTSAAFAAATVMSYLMPERSKEFMGMAMQTAYARVYGGVHFPSDVAAGAKLATTIASYLCATSHIDQLASNAPADRPARPTRRRGRRRTHAHAA